MNPARSLATPGGELVAPGSPTLYGLSRGFLRVLQSRSYAELSIRSYGEALALFLSFAESAGVASPADVTPLMLDAYFVWLKERRGASDRTIAHRRHVLISFWRWLEHDGFAASNVARKTFPIRLGRRLPRYLEPHQIDAFLVKLAGLSDTLGRRDHAMIATFFYSGLRVAELARLRVDEVDLIANRIHVREGKGNKDRTLFVAPALRPVLREYLDDVRPVLLSRLRGPAEASPPEPWLFLSSPKGRRRRHGQPLLTRSIFHVVRDRARELLGVNLTPHMLRHTCATYLHAQNAAIETIQRHLGHSDVRSTFIYMHTPSARMEDEIAAAFTSTPKRKGRPA